MKYLVIGKNGQLGSEFCRQLTKKGKAFLATSHQELNIDDFQQVKNLIKAEKPDVVINTSAYNLVDLAEKDFEAAYRTNYLGVYNLLLAKQESNFRLIHYSTDYVFPGREDFIPYTEIDLPNPLNHYARSKYLGENLLVNNSENNLIFRVSWVFGQGTSNFIHKFLQWAKNNQELRIAENEISVPTSVGLITDLTLKSLDMGLTGLYHLTSSGYCSRYEWALLIASQLGLKNIIRPAKMEEFGLPANRPSFSAMTNQKLSQTLKLEIPEWQKEVIYFLSK